MTDPAQVLDTLRDVLLEHMSGDDFHPTYQVVAATFIGRDSGHLMTEEDVMGGRDVPAGLLLRMGDGSELRLWLEDALQPRGPQAVP